MLDADCAIDASLNTVIKKNDNDDYGVNTIFYRLLRVCQDSVQEYAYKI